MKVVGHVYRLVCPKSRKTIYVGSTKYHFSKRYKAHLAAIDKAEMPLYGYLREHNIVPTIYLLEVVDITEGIMFLRKAEEKWIQRYKAKGANLFNSSRAHKEGHRKKPKNAHISIEYEIYKKIRELAALEGRVIKNQVAYILEKYVEEKQSVLS